MPRIKEYTSQEQAAGPVTVASSPADFGALTYAGADRLGQGIEDAGNFLEKRATQAEVSGLNKQLSDKRAQWTQKITDAAKTADPNQDPHEFTQQFIDGYDKDVAQISDNINTPGGRNFFERSNERLRTSLMQSAVSAQTELAGVYQHENFLSALNGKSTAVLADPSQYESTKDDLSHFLDVSISDPKARMEYLQKGTSELAKSAVLGMMNRSTDLAKNALAKGDFDDAIDGTTKEALMGRIREQDGYNRTEQLRIQEANRLAIHLASEAELGKVIPQIYNDRGVPEVSVDDIANNNKLTPEAKQTMIHAIQHQLTQGATVKSNPDVKDEMIGRIFGIDPDGRPTPTTAELAAHMIPRKTEVAGIPVTTPPDLTKQDFDEMNRWIIGNNTADGKELNKARARVLDIGKQTLSWDTQNHIYKDPNGPTNNDKWVNYVMSQEAAVKAAGKDPRATIFNPESPDYIVPAAKKFGNTLPQIMQNMTRGVGGAADQSRAPQGVIVPPSIDYRSGGGLNNEQLANVKAGRPAVSLPAGQSAPNIPGFDDLSNAIGKGLGAGSGRVDTIMRLYPGASETGKTKFLEELKSLGYTGPLPGDQRVVPQSGQPSSDPDKLRKPGESIDEYLKRMRVR